MGKSTSNRRRGAKLPGVSLQPLDGSGLSWRMRWSENGRDREKRLRDTPRALAEKLRQSLQVELMQARRDAARENIEAELTGVTMAQRKAQAAAQLTIADAIARAYWQHLNVKAGRSQATLRNTERALMRFVDWCSLQGLTYLDRVTQPDLARYRIHLHGMVAQRRYKMSSVNLELKIIRTAFYRALGDGLAPSLRHDQVKSALKHEPISKPEDKRGHKLKLPRALSPEEIRKALLAALAYDARPRPPGIDEHFRRKSLAVDLAMLLLWGFRRLEYCSAKCGAVLLHKTDVTIDILGKGDRPRDVHSEGFTFVGADIALAQKEGHGDDEWLSEHAYQRLDRVFRIARKGYGMPTFTLHDLRATCATYQTCLAVDLHRRVRRLGHSVEVADSNYVATVRELPLGAPSLEAAMGAEAEFAAVLKAQRARKLRARSEPRLHKIHGIQKALLYSDNKVLEASTGKALRAPRPEAAE